jgi:hypothetical protein
MNMKKTPFLYALGAAAYIVAIVYVVFNFSGADTPAENSILVPATMISIFVLSAAVMGFLFLSEPFKLYFDDKKNEAAAFFMSTVGYFAGFVLLFVVIRLLFLDK